MKYINTEKLIAEIERLQELLKSPLCECLTDDFKAGGTKQLNLLRSFITSHQQEQPEENKLPNKRARVNYAICNLQSFKPLREAIVLDDYVYDEGKSYRENLLNYIHAIPESRLTEIRGYLKEKGRWPYDDDADWGEQDVDLEKELKGLIKNNDNGCSNLDIARHFYELGLKARKLKI